MEMWIFEFLAINIDVLNSTCYIYMPARPLYSTVFSNALNQLSNTRPEFEKKSS